MPSSLILFSIVVFALALLAAFCHLVFTIWHFVFRTSTEEDGASKKKDRTSKKKDRTCIEKLSTFTERLTNFVQTQPDLLLASIIHLASAVLGVYQSVQLLPLGDQMVEHSAQEEHLRINQAAMSCALQSRLHWNVSCRDYPQL